MNTPVKFQRYLIDNGLFLCSSIVMKRHGYIAKVKKFSGAMPKRAMFTSLLELEESFNVFLSFYDIEKNSEINELFHRKW